MTEHLRYFPYEFRENQKDCMEFIQENLLKGKHICLNAETGFGKTPVILSSLLHLINKDPSKQKIIWIVKTGNATDRPIEELKKINEKNKGNVFGISFRGKGDMCFLINPEKKQEMNNGDVAFFCQQNKKHCKYLKNFAKKDYIPELLEFMQSAKTYSEIVEFCKIHSLCPYALQYELLKKASVISFSYNYIIKEGIGESIQDCFNMGNSFLVVDEAHNLQTVASTSEKISINALLRAQEELAIFDDITDSNKKVKNILSRIFLFFEQLQKKENNEMIVDKKSFFKFILDNMSEEDFKSCLKKMIKFGNDIRKNRLEQGKLPRSSLFHLSIFLASFLATISKQGVVLISNKQVSGQKTLFGNEEFTNIYLELWDMRSSELLSEKWEQFKGCLFCSGTLTPIQDFSEIAGICKDNYKDKDIPSIYNESNAKVIITKGVSTKGMELSRKTIEDYEKLINDFIKIQDKNIAFFFSSYRIQSKFIQFIENLANKFNREVFIEYEGMSGKDSKDMLSKFKKASRSLKKAILIGTCSGRFAEGADFPSEELEGIMVVGVPFNKMDLKTKTYVEYYKEKYGYNKGVHLSYVVPALRKASQALGRALRSKEDRAVIVLADDRYVLSRNLDLLPNFVKKHYKFLDINEISQEINGFWGK